MTLFKNDANDDKNTKDTEKLEIKWELTLENSLQIKENILRSKQRFKSETKKFSEKVKNLERLH